MPLLLKEQNAGHFSSLGTEKKLKPLFAWGVWGGD